MIVQCPQCQTRYRLDEKHFAGRPELRLRCTKCEATFTARPPAQAPAPVPAPAPAPAAAAPPSGGAPSSASSMAEATLVSKKGAGLQLPADKRVALSVTQGPLKGKVYPVSKARVVLGRLGADIVVEDPEVSRKHCAVEVYGGNALLVDLGSTNGTFVDDNKVETHKLEHLSEFRIGGTTLMLTLSKKE